jgi:hypothetical protein
MGAYENHRIHEPRPRPRLGGDGDGLFRLNKTGRDTYPVVYPTLELAAAETFPDAKAYIVTAEIEDGTIFEVLGRIDWAGKEFGAYTAGFFWDYDDAFQAAEGLGYGGNRTNILVRPGVTEIFEDFASWKAQFNATAIVAGPKTQDRVNLFAIVDVVSVA